MELYLHSPWMPHTGTTSSFLPFLLFILQEAVDWESEFGMTSGKKQGNLFNLSFHLCVDLCLLIKGSFMFAH